MVKIPDPNKFGDDLEILTLKWDEFLEYFKPRWKPGDHLALVGPTGTGKSTLMVGLLPTRKYVLALDPKGGDTTLSKLEKVGFEKVSWPLDDKHWRDMAEGKGGHYIIGSGIRTVEDLGKLRQMLALALRDAFDQTGWTVYIDELQIAADKRLMNLGASIERNLIAARDRKVSMVGSFQRPANVPRSASEMSTWFVVYYTRDRDTVDRLAQMAGRASDQMRGLVRGLPEYCVLIFSRNPRDPIIVTKAPAV